MGDKLRELLSLNGKNAGDLAVMLGVTRPTAYSLLTKRTLESKYSFKLKQFPGFEELHEIQLALFNKENKLTQPNALDENEIVYLKQRVKDLEEINSLLRKQIQLLESEKK